MQILSGRTAVITGAGSGIGRALALHCVGRGMRVVLADIDEAALSATAATAGGDALAVHTDVADAEAVEALAQQTFARYGEVGFLFNNAGVAIGGRTWETGPEDWAWVLSVNLMGVVHGIQSFVPRMLSQGQPGHVINTASAAGLMTVPGASIYCASKHAVVALSECLLQELRSHGAPVGVSVLCPSYVRTGIAESERHRPAALRRQQPAPPVSDEKLLHGMRVATLTADEIAAFAVDGVQKGAFYLLPHSAVLPTIMDRAQRIAQGQVPGRAALPEESDCR